MRVRRWIVAGFIGVTGCSSLQPVSVAFITETKPAVVYLSDGFGAVTTVANPRVSGDTILGTTPGSTGELRVPLSDVQRVKAVRLNRGRTIMLVGGLVAAGAFTAYAVLSPAGERSDFTCDYNNPTYLGPQCGFPNP